MILANRFVVIWLSCILFTNVFLYFYLLNWLLISQYVPTKDAYRYREKLYHSPFPNFQKWRNPMMKTTKSESGTWMPSYHRCRVPRRLTLVQLSLKTFLVTTFFLLDFLPVIHFFSLSSSCELIISRLAPPPWNVFGVLRSIFLSTLASFSSSSPSPPGWTCSRPTSRRAPSASRPCWRSSSWGRSRVRGPPPPGCRPRDPASSGESPLGWTRRRSLRAPAGKRFSSGVRFYLYGGCTGRCKKCW